MHERVSAEADGDDYGASSDFDCDFGVCGSDDEGGVQALLPSSPVKVAYSFTFVSVLQFYIVMFTAFLVCSDICLVYYF